MQTKQKRFSKKTPHRAKTPFPSAWLWLVDDTIPVLVEERYSPRDSWKGKPFGKEDAHFFFRGINELSERFTEERSKGIPAYFQHEKFRSSYLLYFLPLQAAKFYSLFEMHTAAMEAAVAHGKEAGKIRIADLGCGPGTASLAALLWLLDWSLKHKTELPKIELHWWDTNASIIQDGQDLINKLTNGFPRLREKVELTTHAADWWEIARTQKDDFFSLTLLGHVLNEAAGPQPSENDSGRHDKWLTLWSRIFAATSGGGILLLEPASRKTAQYLSVLRNHFFSSALVESAATSLWGPCLHAGNCPLSEGRDWCHFSVPAEIPGKWFREFSKGLGSERNWLKFSYLWIAAKAFPSPLPDRKARRVISDPLGTDKGSVLICEPDVPGRFKISSKKPVFRGEMVKV